MSSPDLSRIKKLPVPERLSVVEDIWDSIARDASKLEVPVWHRQVLHSRLAAHRANPDAGSKWTEVRRRIERSGKSKK